MANHPSVIKRQRQSEKQHEINRAVKSALKTAAKKVEQAADEKNGESAKSELVKMMKAFDKAASSGVMHRNTASRKIGRLSAKVAKLGTA